MPPLRESGPFAPPPETLRMQLTRILGSRGFAQAQRLCRFLEHVVNAAAAGDAGRVKEYALGVEVFERGQDFDPRVDPIVRVQAAKLRLKLYSAVFESRTASSASPITQRTSVAVLPFVNMSADAENEYFSDGLTEEIINALTSISGLQVVARTSVFRFKGQAQDVREIGARLNVSTILEGVCGRQDHNCGSPRS